MGRFSKYLDIVDQVDPIKHFGKIRRVTGYTVESIGPQTEVGELCYIQLKNKRRVPAEVVGFKDKSVILMPYSEMEGIYPGCEVTATGDFLKVVVSEDLKGRVLNGIGKPIDGKGDVYSKQQYSVFNEAPHPLKRQAIRTPLSTGIKAIDASLTVGKGQRIGIFSGAGVGKSTLLGMLARNVQADVNVIALIGERGKEVGDFIRKDLGEEGLSKSILVVATADAPPMMRLKGAFIATAIAEYFRDKRMDVVFMMDSITRFARAQRDVGLASGEPPAIRGFPPSVFKLIPELVERTGTGAFGSITAFYNVLVEADDFSEPISDAIRGHLDGHIDLTREQANKGHYPAIDITSSISRVAIDVVSDRYMKNARKLKEIIAIYKEAEELINIGAYVKGSNPKIDYAITMINKINDFLRQGINEKFTIEESAKTLFDLFREDNFDPNIDLMNYGKKDLTKDEYFIRAS